MARAYHTDPASVAEWDAYRLGVALLCLEQADADSYSAMQRIKAPSGEVPVAPVFVVGRNW